MGLSGRAVLLRFERLTDAHNNYLLMFLSSTRWVALRLEVITNLVTLSVALFVAFGTTSVSHSYKAMALSFVLQVRTAGARSGRGQARGARGIDYISGFGRR